MNAPTVVDIYAARRRIRPYLPPTPLRTYHGINQLLGAEAWIKHENHQPTCAFKIRGGINLVSQMTPDERSRGVVTASTGNHGQSIALAAQTFGVRATICVPDGANPDKVAAIRSYGAEIAEHGRDFDEARINAESISKEKSLRYIHSANEPHLVAGVGTIGLEMMEEQPDLDAVIAPIGGGSCASGCSIVFKALKPDTRVIGVQAEAAPSVYLSYMSGKLEQTPPVTTFADGLATRQAFELPVQILRKNLDDFVLVSEAEMKQAIKIYADKAHTIAEGAGAASLAAAIKLKDQLKGEKVGLVLSGGNLMVAMLREILSKP